MDNRKIYLAELLEDEKVLNERMDVMREARTRYILASRRYSSTRNVVTGWLEESPYSKDFSDWVERGNQAFQIGKFRFVHMLPGDAVKEVLRESEQPLTLDEIVEILHTGGYGVTAPPPTPFVPSRTINAALLKTSGIEKTADDRYRYDPTTDEEED